MVAVEFIDPASGRPAPESAKRVQSRAPQRGLILRTCGFWHNVIRFGYSPTTPDVVFNEGLKILGEVMSLRIR